MRDRLAILAYRHGVFMCCRVLFHVLSRVSLRVVCACCSHALSRAVRAYRALFAREIKREREISLHLFLIDFGG
uniref:Uncharacterized protein n=1 Tax=Zea mays TaxID=4577 RepID=C0P8Q2_MAIZE|nr:unknown [Zea mays]